MSAREIDHRHELCRWMQCDEWRRRIIKQIVRLGDYCNCDMIIAKDFSEITPTGHCAACKAQQEWEKILAEREVEIARNYRMVNSL